MPGPALFARFPSLEGRIPWRGLRGARRPTRVHRAPDIAGVPASVELWIKRDDESGERYGGNKVRKLEFLLADAAARGCTRLVTMGAWGSHHVLATALYGGEAGFSVEAVVVPQPLTPEVLDHLLIDAACGARLRPARSYATLPLHVLGARLGRKVGWIAPGGSSALGSLGYVSAGLELMGQIEAGECPLPDVVYVPLGSCGTAAGLWVGLALAGYRGRIVAVRVVDQLYCNRLVARALAQGILRLLRHHDVTAPPALLDGPRFTVEDRFFGAGYAHASDEGTAAIAAAKTAGISLEPTYTGKTFAALLADASAGRLDGQRVLFVDTFSSAPLGPLLPASRDPSLLPPPLARLFTRSADHMK